VAITLNNLGTLEGVQNYLEEALRIYRQLAQKERETYLPYVATTLNNPGILNRAQYRPEDARKAFEEALKIYEAFAKQDPDQFSPRVVRHA
jgi:tetratricopeptide (TPR) repeat protein